MQDQGKALASHKKHRKTRKQVVYHFNCFKKTIRPGKTSKHLQRKYQDYPEDQLTMQAVQSLAQCDLLNQSSFDNQFWDPNNSLDVYGINIKRSKRPTSMHGYQEAKELHHTIIGVFGYPKEKYTQTATSNLSQKPVTRSQADRRNIVHTEKSLPRQRHKCSRKGCETSILFEAKRLSCHQQRVLQCKNVALREGQMHQPGKNTFCLSIYEGKNKKCPASVSSRRIGLHNFNSKQSIKKNRDPNLPQENLRKDNILIDKARVSLLFENRMISTKKYSNLKRRVLKVSNPDLMAYSNHKVFYKSGTISSKNFNSRSTSYQLEQRSFLTRDMLSLTTLKKQVINVKSKNPQTSIVASNFSINHPKFSQKNHSLFNNQFYRDSSLRISLKHHNSNLKDLNEALGL